MNDELAFLADEVVGKACAKGPSQSRAYVVYIAAQRIRAIEHIGLKRSSGHVGFYHIRWVNNSQWANKLAVFRASAVLSIADPAQRNNTQATGFVVNEFDNILCCFLL
jgi:hypothetical protein